MGVKDKSGYLTALFRLLPFGVLALYYGIQGLVYKTSTDSLYKIHGEVIYAGTKTIQSKRTSTYKDAFVIEVSDNRYDTIECYTFVTVDRKALQVLEGVKGGEIMIWVDPESDNLIEQVKYNGRLIIEFNGAYYVYLFFVTIGIVYTVITLIYLISYPEHLFKRSDSQ